MTGLQAIEALPIRDVIIHQEVGTDQLTAIACTWTRAYLTSGSWRDINGTRKSTA